MHWWSLIKATAIAGVTYPVWLFAVSVGSLLFWVAMGNCGVSTRAIMALTFITVPIVSIAGIVLLASYL